MGMPVSAGVPRSARWCLGAVGFVGLALLLSACHGGSHNLHLLVNTTADGGDADPGDGICEMTPTAGDCSLRAAVDEANASPELVPIVTVPAGTYPLTLDGSDDTNATGDLDLDPASGHAVIISDALMGAVIDANENDGALDIVAGDVAIGGLAVTGATQAGVTVGAHTTSTFGWSAAHHNPGAGVVVEETGVLRIVNSTISTNGSGGIRNDGWIDVDWSTVTANTGGGITGASFAHLRSSIVANQASGPDCWSPAYSYGYNLDSDGSCLRLAEESTDLVGVPASLLPLSSDPVPYHLAGPTSPAIDSIGPGAGGPCSPGLVDQRQIARPVGPRCDRGSVEQ